MSETLRVGQFVVVQNAAGCLLPEYGIGGVTASDVSSVVAVFRDGSADIIAKVNAGSLKWGENTIRAATQADANVFSAAEKAAEREQLDQRQVSDLRCYTCCYWRPPFNTGPGNCHNRTVVQLTRKGDESYPPPTSANWGCVCWQSKDQPENGDDSDEDHTSQLG